MDKNNRKIKRLFILEKDELRTTFSLLPKPEPTDYFLIIKRQSGGITFPDSVMRNLKRCEGQIEERECDELSNEDFCRYIPRVIKEIGCDSEHTVVYFVYCPNFVEILKSDVEAVCKRVSAISKIKEAKPSGMDIDDPVSDSDMYENGDTKARNSTHNTSIEQTKLDDEDSKTKNEDIGDAVNSLLGGGKSETGNKENKWGREEKTRKKRDDRERPKNSKATKSADNTNEGAPENDGPTLRQLEKNIFNDAKIEDVKDPDYSAMDKEKISLLLSVFNRFKDHINIVIKNPDDLDDDDYNSLIIQFIKSNNPDEFNTSVNIIAPKVQIKIPSIDIFSVLKGEAEYYIKTCDLFYKEDKWIE